MGRGERGDTVCAKALGLEHALRHREEISGAVVGGARERVREEGGGVMSWVAQVLAGY